MHGASAEKVEMQVADGLATIGAGVDDQAVSVANASSYSALGRGCDQPPEHRGMSFEGLFRRG